MRSKKNARCRCFLSLNFVISCQHLELDDIISSFAALNSLKLTVWELHLCCVHQREWRGNTAFEAVHTSTNVCRQQRRRWKLRSLLDGRGTVWDTAFHISVAYVTQTILIPDWHHKSSWEHGVLIGVHLRCSLHMSWLNVSHTATSRWTSQWLLNHDLCYYYYYYWKPTGK